MAGNDDIVARLEAIATCIERGSTSYQDAAVYVMREAATALAERDATIERLTKERDEVLANHQWAQDRLDDAEARAIAAEDEVELLKAAIFGAPNYDADLTTGCFVEMARSVEAARQGALDRATAAERERDEARAEVERKDAALKRLLDACPEEHGCFPRNRCQSEHMQSDDDELTAAIAVARAALRPSGGDDVEG